MIAIGKMKKSNKHVNKLKLFNKKAYMATPHTPNHYLKMVVISSSNHFIQIRVHQLLLQLCAIQSHPLGYARSQSVLRGC